MFVTEFIFLLLLVTYSAGMNWTPLRGTDKAAEVKVYDNCIYYVFLLSRAGTGAYMFATAWQK